MIAPNPLPVRGRVCGVRRHAADPASSGLTNRHRLNRRGDRQLNRALHTIVLIRMRIDPATKVYIQRRTTEGQVASGGPALLEAGHRPPGR
ncbi:transposase [Streptomyces sp. NPDC005283]|uniref:transposase n=1 Tax=Streptomyces sp. NPDC005283 TaxID=3156871 RepID=UPI003456B2E5